MNLIPLEELVAALVCPRCQAPVAEGAEAFRCTGCGETYRVLRGQPVLVDFSDSILIERDVERYSGASAIDRGTKGFKRRLIQSVLPSNQVAGANASLFIKLARDLAERPTVLMIGGGSKGEGTEELYSSSGIRLIAFDIYGSELTQFIADAHRTPLADASVDAVWIQAVLEHVLDPWRVAAEIHRVLRPRGIVYAETPFLQQVHEGAYDFTRFTESGHRWLFRQFEVIDSGVVLGASTQLLWSVEHVVRGLFRSVAAGVAAKIMLFWLRYLDRLIPRGYSSDAASAVFFLGRKSHSAIGPSDMISFYRGANARSASGSDGSKGDA